MVDVSKLQVGQVYSYKQLCELTGAEYKKGRSRTLQMENFSENGFPRFFDFEKYSYGKYIIKEIYDEPLPIKSNRDSGNNSVYLLFIELILIKYLSKDYYDEIIFSKGKLWRLLGMVNNNYGEIDNSELYSLDKSVNEFEVNNFYLRANHKLSDILSRALSNLSDRSLIQATPIKMICKNVMGNNKYEIAKEDDIKKILEVERKALDELGYEKKSEVFLKPIRVKDKFYEIINSTIESRYGWVYYYDAYKIIFNYEDIKKFIPRLELSLKDALIQHNQEIMNCLNKDAENAFYSNRKKYQEGLDNCTSEAEYRAALNKFHYSDNYITAQEIIAKKLINISNNIEDLPRLDNEDINSEMHDEIFFSE